MAIAVVSGASCVCTFGTAPGSLVVTDVKAMCGGKPQATIQDTMIPTFGMCTSMANPAVATATTAAMGVLTPQPCQFSAAGVWTGGGTKCMCGGKPALTNDATIHCVTGQGTVSVVNPGQSTVMI